jgi:pentatricopeptide repeat protein
LIEPFFDTISNFIGNYQLLATQASPEEEVTAEVLNQILTTIENAPKPNGEICTAYVDKLCEAGNLSAAARLLQSLRDKHIFRSPKAYNLLLGAASERHDIELLSQVFKDLLVSQGSLSSTSYLYVAKAFAKTSDGIQLLRFVKEVSAMTSPSATVINRIIFAFAECGQVDKALLIYDLIKSLSCKPDLITYNTILDVLGRAGRTDEMLHEFASMKGAGIVPDFVSYNTLLNNLRKVGRLDLCLVYFRDMGENGVFKEMKLRQIRPSIYVYRSLIKNLKKIGKLELAMKYLEEMNSCLTDLAGPNDFKRRRR